VSVFRDVTERQQAVEALRQSEERFALLASASRALLASSLDAQALAERLADVVVPVLADWCSVWELDANGQGRRVVVRLGPRHGPGLARRLAAAPDPFAGHPLWEAVARGDPTLVADVRPWLDHHMGDAALFELMPTSLMAVPIVARSGVVGAMLLTGAAPRSYASVDLELAEDLGRRASQAVDIARAYQAEQRAREAAEEATARLALLADLSLLLAGSLDIDELLRSLQRRVQGVLADACIVDLVVEEGGTRRVTGVADGDARAEAVAAALGGRTTFEPHAPGPVAGSRSAALVTVPVVGRTGPLGALTFVATGRSGLTLETDDVALAEEIGRRAGVAIDNARLYAERSQAAATLTRALLPDTLPDVPGLELAARYRPAAAGVGGDFYDVVPMGGGQWLFAIADVCGKGPEAGSLTAMTRYTLRTLARNHRRPAELLEAANQALADALPDDRFWTAACAVVEPGVRSARVSLAVAGHPTPLVVRGTGEVGACGRPGMLIGVFDRLGTTDDELVLGPGDALVMFTDGAVGEGRDAMTMLAPCLEVAAGATAAGLAEAVEAAARLIEPDHPDDIAVLAVRVPAEPAAEQSPQ
jgi:GAF domain-containing protein